MRSARGLTAFILLSLALQLFAGVWHHHDDAADAGSGKNCVVCVGLGQSSGPAASVAEPIDSTVLELYSTLEKAEVLPFDLRIPSASPRGPPASL